MSETVTDRINQVRAGRSEARFARELGIPYTTARAFFRGRSPNIEFLAAISEQENIDLTWLVTGQREHEVLKQADWPSQLRELADELEAFEHTDRPIIKMVGPEDRDTDPNYITVPLMAGQAAAGFGGVVKDEVEDWAVIYKKWVKHPDHTACLKVEGDSMWPVLPEHSVVAVDYHPETLGDVKKLEGAIVAAWLSGGITIKWLHLHDGDMILQPANPEHPQQRIPADQIDDFRIRGKVIWAWSLF